MQINGRKPSLVIIAILVILEFLSGLSDYSTELNVQALRSDGNLAIATVVGAQYFKLSPITSIVEYVDTSGKIVRSKLVLGQLADQEKVEVVYDPLDTENVSLASGGRFHIMAVLSFFFLFLALFELYVGLENWPSR